MSRTCMHERGCVPDSRGKIRLDFRCCIDAEHDYNKSSAVDACGCRLIKGHPFVLYIIVTCHFRAIAMRVLEVESSALGRYNPSSESRST